MGDTHGTTHWKTVIDREKFDKLVMLGDYVDSFHVSGINQIENLKDIIQFKLDNKDKVVLLIGNHDASYWDGFGETCSGYQRQYQYLIRGFYADHKDLFQVAYEFDNVLCTHAGVTGEFLSRIKGKMLVEDDDKTPVADLLNEAWRINPRLFNFYGWDPSGEDPEQGCLWVRPRSLMTNSIEGYVQVVGHTRMRRAAIAPEKDFYFMDLMEGERPGYLVVEDGKFEVKYLDNGNSSGEIDTSELNSSSSGKI